MNIMHKNQTAVLVIRFLLCIGIVLRSMSEYDIIIIYIKEVRP